MTECLTCEGVGEVVVNTFQAGDQTAEEWGPCPDCTTEPTAEQWLDAAEHTLREIHANSHGQIEDPHFRHWASVTVLTYFSAKGEDLTSSPTEGRSDA